MRACVRLVPSAASRVPRPVLCDGDVAPMAACSGHQLCDGGPLFGEAEPTRSFSSAAAALWNLLTSHAYNSAAIERTGTNAAAGGPPGGDEYFARRTDTSLALLEDAQGVLLLLFLLAAHFLMRSLSRLLVLRRVPRSKLKVC